MITSTAAALLLTNRRALAFDPSPPDERAALVEPALGDEPLRAEVCEAECLTSNVGPTP